ncbi:hypothetical protein [Bradyrhizobium sp. Ec3.3]|uniref:hypothetical protein n=1 Tax=Bradyrhizobium sp. Ec3.3 TaxID=189753 RepID=UPI0012EC071B|nr:hypothetical protein [Bradyrhizobium sp. Ec3.3]
MTMANNSRCCQSVPRGVILFSVARQPPAVTRVVVAIEESCHRVRLKRDEIGLNRHRALGYCLSMIFSENRFTLFRIML